MSEPTYCEVCGEVNVWHLFGEEYGHVCKPCVEIGDDVGVCDNTGNYRKLEPCIGCGKIGTLNYGRYDTYWCHFCGGSPRCCP